MVDNNALLQYNKKYFGKFIPIKPKNFLDLKTYGERFTIPYSLPALITTKYDPDQYFGQVAGLNTSSFYNRIDMGPKRGCYNTPKKFAIIKHNEFTVTHSVLNFSKTIYELLVIFPDDFIVPGQLRMIKFFGKPEWFEPYVDPQTETSNFVKSLIKDIKSKR